MAHVLSLGKLFGIPILQEFENMNELKNCYLTNIAFVVKIVGSP